MQFRKPIIVLSITIIALFIISVVVLVIYPILNQDKALVVTPELPTIAMSIEPTSAYQVQLEPTDIWDRLQVRTPNPYSSPLPPAERSPLDGTFAKFDLSWPQWWACRRCADYRPAGGIWRLRFDHGVMRIYYNVTEWVSLASFTVSGNRIYIFNDPICPEAVGEYEWSLTDKWGLSDRELRLRVLDDSCSFGLRGENLSTQEWSSCSPPNLMTAASDHWHKPPGCEDPDPALLKAEYVSIPAVNIRVHPGYVKRFVRQPTVYVDANQVKTSLPRGIEVRSDADSIPYGLNRVLWGEGSWVEASTDIPFKAIGVQVYGDHTIGWARVLFDGEEVWRGNTLEIGSDKDRFGGYIEISDFEDGLHTIHIESLGADYHPVTVAFFGFSEDGGVEAGGQ